MIDNVEGAKPWMGPSKGGIGLGMQGDHTKRVLIRGFFGKKKNECEGLGLMGKLWQGMARKWGD